MEFFRTEGFNKDKYQWCDSEKFMVMDTVTGEIIRVDGISVVSFDKARDHVSSGKGMERRIIVRVSCVEPFKI